MTADALRSLLYLLDYEPPDGLVVSFSYCWDHRYRRVCMLICPLLPRHQRNQGEARGYFSRHDLTDGRIMYTRGFVYGYAHCLLDTDNVIHNARLLSPAQMRRWRKRLARGAKGI